MFKINPDSIVHQALSRIFDILWVTVLWLLFSLPVATFGAATTAMMMVFMGMDRRQAGGVTVTFWQAFCTNFKCATQIWAVLAFLWSIVVGNIYAGWLSPVSKSTSDAVRGVAIAIAVVFLVISLYIFPVVAKLYVTVWQAFKNSVLFGFHYPLHTLGLMILSAVFVAGCSFFLWYALFFIGFVLYAQAQLLRGCFDHYLQLSAAADDAIQSRLQGGEEP